MSSAWAYVAVSIAVPIALSYLGLLVWLVRSLLENTVITRELQKNVRRLEDAVWPPRREYTWRREETASGPKIG